jgi:hypothetical protein
VEQVDDRRDPAIEQRVDDATVVVEPALVGRPMSIREDARPRDREPERIEPELGDEVRVLLEPVVVVAGDVAGLAAERVPGRVRERVPDRRSASVLARGALDLIGRGGRPPEEALGEGLLGDQVSSPP